MGPRSMKLSSLQGFSTTAEVSYARKVPMLIFNKTSWGPKKELAHGKKASVLVEEKCWLALVSTTQG